MDKYKKPLKKFAATLQKYVVVLFVLAIAALCGYLVLASASSASKVPEQADIDLLYQPTSKVKIDENIASRLRELEEQNIEVKALFDEARDNPFTETPF